MKASFGEVKLFGHKYKKDLILHVDGKITKRKKKKSKDLKPQYGHTPLSEKELDFLSDEKPKIVYIGTGYQNALPITDEARKILAEYETVILPTPEIVNKVEQEEKDAVAIIHVTC